MHARTFRSLASSALRLARSLFSLSSRARLSASVVNVHGYERRCVSAYLRYARALSPELISNVYLLIALLFAEVFESFELCLLLRFLQLFSLVCTFSCVHGMSMRCEWLYGVAHRKVQSARVRVCSIKSKSGPPPPRSASFGPLPSFFSFLPVCVSPLPASSWPLPHASSALPAWPDISGAADEGGVSQ